MPSAVPLRAPPEAVLAARRRFFSGVPVGEDVLAAPILRSWTRCAARGLPANGRPHAEPLGRGELALRRERHEGLRRHCRAELEALHASAAVSDSIAILTDPTGLVLDTVGSIEFADRAAQVALRPGVNWSEADIGTNAIGTALVERRAVEVRGAEHYTEAHGILTCAAAPIHDPRGELVGLLDLSGPASVPHMHALGLVQLAADQVEHRLFEGAFPGHNLVRFHRDASFLGTAREGILVFEDYRLVAANRPGLALLGLGWDALTTRRFGDLFEGTLGRPGEVRRVRALGGDVVMRLERPGAALIAASTPLRTPAAPPLRASAPGSIAQGGLIQGAVLQGAATQAAPATAADAAGPRFDPQSERDLARAVRLLEAGVPVLVQGETGAGKDVFARRMHGRCSRADRAFAAVNCAALPEGLIESELFGYEEGAFTGARRAGFKGLFREADGGILFLDEIGDMPLSLQSRLLRVLQEREVTPLGGGRAVKVDFALICATHRNLKALVEQGAFRADLYFRIAQYTIALPALRTLAEREEMILRIWRETAGADAGPRLSADCLAMLVAYDWPGNFRQLAGTLKVLHALAEPGELLEVEALPVDIRAASHPPAPAAAAPPPAAGRPAEAGPPPVAAPALAGALDAVTRAAMDAALQASGGNVSQAARRLGIHRSTLHRHLGGAGGPKPR